MPVRHVTLAPDTVMTVTVPIDYDAVAVFHKSGSAPIWATVNDVDPVADGDDNYYIPAGGRRRIVRAGQAGPADVRLLSTAAATVEVEFA